MITEYSEASNAEVAVVDLGTGNIGSVVNMLRRLGATPSIVTDPARLDEATRLILPGVGHWDSATRHLDLGFRESLEHLVITRRVPILGICLGMQMLLECSEEGDLPGLAWIPGVVRRFDVVKSHPQYKVPHMGWNSVCIHDEEMRRGLSDEARFYFAHSFHAAEVAREHVAITARHGYEFICGIRREHIWGLQFHPEKSHHFGMTVIRNFLGSGEC